ncbi:MAG TPA: DUF4245 family protein [Nocardioides sp.]|uniref:DUF4245 family protein n=1 Tax=Nocardioides sp. TaxID=35761 RepID=UPI002E3337B4|nr:DUF4245 family protein [Nocardioides sp.]HEX5087095.1 DUF4245 family protein [Nocardioides sp.]
MHGIPKAVAGLALVAVTVVGCGDEDGDSPTATDPTSGSTSPAASPTPSATESSSATPSDSGDPVPSPIIDKAVKDAIRDGFPALVPSGVPAGWTVTKATYSPKRGGQWWIRLTDANGADVTLAQSKKSVEGIVHQYLEGAQPAGNVDLSSYGTGKWSAYTGTIGDAVAKALSGTSAVVVGPDMDTVTTLAQDLLTAEDAGSSDDGG